MSEWSFLTKSLREFARVSLSAGVGLVNTFYSSGNPIAQPSLIPSTSTVYDVNVIGNRVIVPNFIQSNSQVFSVSASKGDAFIFPDMIIGTNIFRPIVIIETRIIQPDFMFNYGLVFSPTVFNDNSVIPQTVISTGQVYSPTITIQNPTLVPAFVAPTGVIYAPTVLRGLNTIVPAFLAPTGTVPTVALTGGSVVVRPNFIAATGQVFAPSLSTGSITIVPSVLAATGGPFPINIRPVIRPNFIGSGETIFSPIVGLPTDNMSLSWESDLIASILITPEGRVAGTGAPAWATSAGYLKRNPDPLHARGIHADPTVFPTSDPFPIVSGKRNFKAEYLASALTWVNADGYSNTDRVTSAYLHAANVMMYERGTMIIRAKLTEPLASWFTYWLCEISGEWPPEYDIVERQVYAGTLVNEYGVFDHYNSTPDVYSPTNGGLIVSVPGANLTTEFHDYALKLDALTATFYIDNKPVYSAPNRAPTTYWYPIISLWSAPTVGTGIFPVSAVVEYVKLYSPAGFPPRINAPVPIRSGTSFDTLRSTPRATITNGGLTITNTNPGGTTGGGDDPIPEIGYSYAVANGKVHVAFSVTGGDRWSAGFVNNAHWGEGWGLGSEGNAIGLYADGFVYYQPELFVDTLVVPGTQTVQMCADCGNKLLWVKVGSGNWNGDSLANPVTGVGGLNFSYIEGDRFLFAAHMRELGDSLTIQNVASPAGYVSLFGVSSGGQITYPPLISATGQIFSPTVLRGTKIISPNLIAASGQVFASVVKFTQVIIPNMLTGAGSIFNPTVNRGTIAIVPAFISATGQAFSPIVTRNTIVVIPSFLAASGSVFGPKTEIKVSPNFLTASNSFFSPTVSQVLPIKVIWDTDMETDNDDILCIAMAIDAHRKGLINLIGVNVCSKFGVSAPDVRAFLDAYGLSSIPVGWSLRAGGANPDFYNTAVRDQFGVPGETGSASRYMPSATFYRTLIAGNPSGVHIVTGGFMKGLVEFMNSPADGISGLTGSQLIVSKNVIPFIGLGRRPGSTLIENNSALDKQNAHDFCAGWPTNITFYCYTDSGAEVPFLHIPSSRDPLIDPFRFAWDLCANSRTLTGDFGAVTLNDGNDERGAGDNLIFQAMLDSIAGTPTANYSYSGPGTMSIDASTGVTTWAMGSGPHRYLTQVTSKAALDTLWQGIVDNLLPPVSVNYWRDYKAAPATLINSGTITANNANSPDGTLTADTMTGGGFAGGYNVYPSPAGHVWTYSVAIKKTSGRTRFPSLTVQALTTGLAVISEAGGVVNTNNGNVYPASGGVAPAYGSMACTMTTADGASALSGPNAGDYWLVTMTFTTPTSTGYLYVYMLTAAGSTGTDATRDGAGGSTSQVVTYFQLEPRSVYSGLLPTDGDATWKVDLTTIYPAFLAATGQVFSPNIVAPQTIVPTFLAATGQVFANHTIGNKTVAPAFLAAGTQIFAPIVGSATQVIAPSLLAATGTVYSPTVVFTPQTVVAGFIAAAGTIYSPTVKRTWTPADLASAPDIWLDAKTASTITHSSGSVSQWASRVGAVTFDQGTSGSRPTYSTTLLGGSQPGVGNRGLGNRRLTSTYSASTYPRAVYALINANFPPTGQARTILGSSGNGGLDFWFDQDPAPAQIVKHNVAVVGTGGTGTRLPDDTTILAGFEVNATAYAFYMDGVSINSGSHSVTLTAGQTAVLLDVGDATTVVELDGEIGEILVFTTIPGGTDREKIEGYIAHRWGISSRLAAGHPYKTTPPLV